MANILLVEAELDGAELAATICLAAGHHVTVASDGEIAWGLLQLRPFDLVVLDLRLPRVDGLTLSRRLRTNKRLAHIGIAVVTARVTGLDRMRLAELGVHEVVLRPYDAGMLRRGVEAALQASSEAPRVEVVRVWSRRRGEATA